MDRCIICHRKILGEESKKRRMGPVCFARYMKVVNTDKEKRKAKKPLKGQVTFFDKEFQENIKEEK